MAEVKAEIHAQQKPGVVFVTKPDCGACVNLKASVKGSHAVRKALESSNFVVAHAPGDRGKFWQIGDEKRGYVPRVYFMDHSGQLVDVKGPNKKYPRFFSSAEEVETAMAHFTKILNGEDDFDPDLALPDEDPDFDPELAVEGEL